MLQCRAHRLATIAAGGLFLSGCAPDTEALRGTLERDATVAIAYIANTIALSDKSADDFGSARRMPVPDAYESVREAVRDAFRASAPDARVVFFDPDREPDPGVVAGAPSDIQVRVWVEGSYECGGGLVKLQTCALRMRARLLIEDRPSSTYTALAYTVGRRSAEIPGTVGWASISERQALAAVPPDSLAHALATDVRRELYRTLTPDR